MVTTSTLYQPIPDLFKRINLCRLYPTHNEFPVMVNCPHHGDHDRPNLAVYPANTHCFACGWGETALDHVRRVRNPHNNQELFAIVRGILDSKPRAKQDTIPSLGPAAMRHYEKSLTSNQDKRRHLLDRYGLRAETQKYAQLGYAGTAYAIPVFNLHGDLVNIRFRRDDTLELENRPKYWGIPGRNGAQWYLPPKVRGKGFIDIAREVWCNQKVYLCEGELDALAAWQIGLFALSSTNGARALLGPQGTEYLEELAGLTVYVCFDQDQPGRDAGTQLVQRLTGLGIKAQQLFWPAKEGKDFSELVAKGHTIASIRNILTR